MNKKEIVFRFLCRQLNAKVDKLSIDHVAEGASISKHGLSN